MGRRNTSANLNFSSIETTVADEDRVGVQFKIDVEYSDGRRTQIFVAGFFGLRDAKIDNFTEVAHFEGNVFHLENH